LSSESIRDPFRVIEGGEIDITKQTTRLYQDIPGTPQQQNPSTTSSPHTSSQPPAKKPKGFKIDHHPLPRNWQLEPSLLGTSSGAKSQ
jgi:hypothetical protein